MLPRSYLILSPAEPSDRHKAIASQRQSIPMVWAFAFSSPAASLHPNGPEYYFETTVGDALAMIDRSMAAWSYNRYFRDVLAPFGVFRQWLANSPSESHLYLNFTEIIDKSVSANRDLKELANLPKKVVNAIEEIEGQHFSPFVHLLRKVSYPMVTIPITGDRETDEEILTQEMRDMPTPEAELALQLVGVDATRRMLHNAIASITLRRGGEEMDLDADEGAPPCPILYTTRPNEAMRILVERLGAEVVSEGHGRMTFTAGDEEFIVVTIGHAADVGRGEE